MGVIEKQTDSTELDIATTERPPTQPITSTSTTAARRIGLATDSGECWWPGTVYAVEGDDIGGRATS